MEEYIEILNGGDSSELESIIKDFNGSLIPLFNLLSKYDLVDEIDINSTNSDMWIEDYIKFL